MSGEFECPGCKAKLNQDDRSHGTCWRCGFKFVPTPEDVQLELVAADPDTNLTHFGFDITWEDYRPAYTFGELRGEWVAQSQTGYAAIRLPAIISNVASAATRMQEKQAALKKLLNLLEGTHQ